MRLARWIEVAHSDGGLIDVPLRPSTYRFEAIVRWLDHRGVHWAYQLK
jgi:hypothetical protein